MTDTLNIIDIQRFALHDGPGIRTTVFLSGCPLHCPWCANPESMSDSKRLMYFENKCFGCGACARVCPSGAVSWENKPVFLRENCNACGNCAKNCPGGAISFSTKEMAIKDVIAEVLRDADYYERTGGGLTVSGGEPFNQPEGLLALLKEAKRKGLHTALETSGHASASYFEASLSDVDLFLIDLKHSDAERLRQVTGGDLDVILKNISRAVGKRTIARIPVIPGFNYCIETLTDILKLAAEHGVREAHLLPYHTLGKSKYARLGISYTLDEAPVGKGELLALLPKIDVPGIEVKVL